MSVIVFHADAWDESVSPDEYPKQLEALIGEWTDANDCAVREWLEAVKR